MTVDDEDRNQAMPQTCVAAVFVGVGRPFEFHAFPIPRPVASEAVVRIECATLCGSDLHTVLGRRTEPQPSILGHEAIGKIVAVGIPAPLDLTGVPLRVGDRVIWSPIIACQTCERCRQGFSQKCLHLRKYGHALAAGAQALSGGFAEYIVLQAGSSIARLNADWDANVFCPASCATATAAAAIRMAGEIADRNILVFGAGLLGLTASAMAKFHGAKSVTIVDVDAKRLALATKFGVERTVCIEAGATENEIVSQHELSDSQFQVVVEMSGSPAAVAASIQLADLAGRIVLVGSVMPSPAVALDPEMVVRRWLSITGVHNYAPQDLQAAVEFLEAARGCYPFADLVEASFPLSQINESITFAISRKPVRVKMVMKEQQP